MKKIILLLTMIISVSMMAEKIAVVNTQEVFSKYSETIKTKEMLIAEKTKLEKNLRKKEVALQKLGIELQGKGNKVTKAEKDKYARQAKDLEKFVKDAQKKLGKKEYDSMKKIESTIKRAIDSIAKSGKYKYVLEAGAVKVGGTDITQKVLKKIESMKK